MSPKRRLGRSDPLDELLVRALHVPPKVKAGNVYAPATLARAGDVSEDGREVEQRVPPAPDRLGRRLELTHGVIVHGGEDRVQVLVDRWLALLHRSMPGASR